VIHIFVLWHVLKWWISAFGACLTVHVKLVCRVEAVMNACKGGNSKGNGSMDAE
jgi:hypothetical protein